MPTVCSASASRSPHSCAVLSTTRSAGPPSCSSTTRRLGPKPRSQRTRASSLAPAVPEAYATMRRPGWSARTSTSAGRPTALTSSTSASGQPSRAHASASAEGCGCTSSRPGPRRRASVAPMPCSIGSPLASTQVLRAVRAAQLVDERVDRRRPRPALGLAVGHQRELPLRADDHLGGEHRARARPPRARPSRRRRCPRRRRGGALTPAPARLRQAGSRSAGRPPSARAGSSPGRRPRRSPRRARSRAPRASRRPARRR